MIFTFLQVISLTQAAALPQNFFPGEGQRGRSMAVGTVKWFNDAKGFGFIEPEGGGPDVFAHFSAVQMDGFRTLRQGGRVNFDLVQGPKGNLAQNIRPIDAPQASEPAVAHSHSTA